MLSGITSLEWKWVKMQLNASGYYSQAPRKQQTLLAICAQMVEKAIRPL
jgi:uncharacterized protein YcgL (UPF0745 family)